MQPEQEASMMLMDNWRDKVLEVIGQFPWYKGIISSETTNYSLQNLP